VLPGDWRTWDEGWSHVEMEVRAGVLQLWDPNDGRVGDITPVSPAARTLAWLEAMMRQSYIAVLVAFLVGIRVSQGPVQRSQGREGDNNP